MGRCVVPDCRGNGVKGPKVRLFSFPRNEARRIEWKRAMARTGVDWGALKDPKICELHFQPHDIWTAASCTDPVTGKTLVVQMGCARLAPDAVPTVLPECPSSTFDFEMPGEQQVPRQHSLLQESAKHPVHTTLVKLEVEEPARSMSFQDLQSQVSQLRLQPFWTVIQAESCLMCLHIPACQTPEVECSVVISEDLSVSVCWRGSKLSSQAELISVPEKVECLSDLQMLLYEMESIKDNFSQDQEGCRTAATVKLIVSLLEDLVSDDLVPAEKIGALKFLKQQLQVIVQEENESVDYPSEILIFACLLYTICARAYEFLRNSGKLHLPPPSTVVRVCRSFDVSPATDQDEDGFLNYVLRRTTLMKPYEQRVTVMLHEVHVEQYSCNSRGILRGAHVFMIQSLLSPWKDVAHILPVATTDAEQLHKALKRLIIRLEKAGLTVVAVIAGNNTTYKAAMSLFSPQKQLEIVHPHPSNPRRPLFFVIDPGCLLKSVWNDWMNQGDPDKCLFFPPFEATGTTSSNVASFNILRHLHAFCKQNLIKLADELPLGALNPSSMEKECVRLALAVFSSTLAETLRTCGETGSLRHVEGTATFIEIMAKWCSIFVPKTRKKVYYLNGDHEGLVTHMSGTEIIFLDKFVRWLDAWQDRGANTGLLKEGTHAALRLTSYACIELCRYCFTELGLRHVHLGKFQADGVDDSCGSRGRLPTSQYHELATDVLKSNEAIKFQGLLVLPSIEEVHQAITLVTEEERKLYDVEVTQEDISLKEPEMPTITYIAGFCAHAAVKKLACEACAENLVIASRELQAATDIMVKRLTTENLKVPQPYAVNIVLHATVALDKLTSTTNRAKFLSSLNQRGILFGVTKWVLCEVGGLEVCHNGHHPDTVLDYVARAVVNTLLPTVKQTKVSLLAKMLLRAGK